MHPSAVLHLLLLLAAAAASQSQALQPPPAAGGRHGTGAAACIPRERDALLAFKRGITRPATPRGIKVTKTAATGEASGAVI